jgi:hypothetical protein
MSRFYALALALLLPTSLVACGDEAIDDGSEDDPLGEQLGGKFDSLKNPTRHGRLFLGAEVRKRLASGERYHEWLFDLDEAASVTIDLGKAGSRAVDTVLYLYKDEGDGSWSLVRKSDDDMGDIMAGMWIDLEPGQYHMVVKGKKKTTRGEFEVELTCFGEGCPTRQCIFGSEYHTLVGFEDAQVRTDWQKVIDADSTIDIPIVIQQIVAAVNASSYEVDTLEEALAAVDEGEINHTQIYDGLHGKTYYAFEYGAGDNSYGAIFESGKSTPAAKIGDGEIGDCKVWYAVPR